MSKNKDPHLCIHPFASLSLHATGHITRCLMSEESMGRIDEKQGLINTWNNSNMTKLRSTMASGSWDSHCRSCIRKEKENTLSKRQHWQKLNITKDLWKDKQLFTTEPKKNIYFLDMAFNNFCNFKCRMCSSAYSSKWLEDEQKLKEMGLKGGSGAWAEKASVALGCEMRSISKKNISELVSLLTETRRIDIVGGEPFLTKDFLNFTNECIKKNKAYNADLTVTTNGSLFDEEYLKALTHFKRVTINISVDGIGSNFNYIRAGNTISWEQFNNNIEKFLTFAKNINKEKPNTWKINLNSAFQMYNFLEINTFLTWVYNKFDWHSTPPEFSSKFRNSFEIRLLMTPAQLNIKNAPKHLLEACKEKLTTVLRDIPLLSGIEEVKYFNDINTYLLNSMNKSNISKKHYWHLFCLYTQSLDKIRNQNYTQTLSSLLSTEITNSLAGDAHKNLKNKWKKDQGWGAHCAMPWEALTITGQGDVKPCCQLRGKVGNVYTSKNKSIAELYNEPSLVDTRKSFIIEEKSEHCKSCWEREEQISHSRRIWFKKKFDHKIKKFLDYREIDPKNPQWLQMDINLSNKCNLKCRMCGSWGSHKWIEDEKKLALNGNPYSRETNENRLQLRELDFKHLASLIPNMQRTERIDFKGGEPMLAKHHVAFLKLLIENKLSKNLTLHYTTNGTVLNKKILSLFNEFKKIELVYSIEATDPLYGYIRGGKDCNTSTLEENLLKYDQINNIKIMCNVTLQAYNLPILADLHSYIYNLPLKNYSPKQAFNCIVNSPKYLSPFVWPMEVRQKYIDKISHLDDFKPLIKSLNSIAFDDKIYQTFLRYTNDLDKIRNESYFDIFPELKDYC